MARVFFLFSLFTLISAQAVEIPDPNEVWGVRVSEVTIKTAISSYDEVREDFHIYAKDKGNALWERNRESVTVGREKDLAPEEPVGFPVSRLQIAGTDNLSFLLEVFMQGTEGFRMARSFALSDIQWKNTSRLVTSNTDYYPYLAQTFNQYAHLVFEDERIQLKVSIYRFHKESVKSLTAELNDLTKKIEAVSFSESSTSDEENLLRASQTTTEALNDLQKKLKK